MTGWRPPILKSGSVLPGSDGKGGPSGWIRLSEAWAELFWLSFDAIPDGRDPDHRKTYEAMWRTLDRVTRVAILKWDGSAQLWDAEILQQPEDKRDENANSAFNFKDGRIGTGLSQRLDWYNHAFEPQLAGPEILLDATQWRAGLRAQGLDQTELPGTIGQETRAANEGRRILANCDTKPTKSELFRVIEAGTGKPLGREAQRRVWEKLANEHPSLRLGGRPKKLRT